MPGLFYRKEALPLLLIFLFSNLLFAQDGRILEKKAILLPDFPANSKDDSSARSELRKPAPSRSVDFSRIVYSSDGLRVVAYVAQPKAPGKYPCIIANRGGNRSFGQWNAGSIEHFLGTMASWGYVVIASQYRGNDGESGSEEFGGKDVNDVLNLVPVLAQIPNADTSLIGLEGGSRGGMMTYLAMKKNCRYKAAVVTAGITDAPASINSRPEMEEVFRALVPGYAAHKESELKSRSALYWPEQLCPTPLLIMHGSSDWRVAPAQSVALVQKLLELKFPVRFILYEGADHGLNEVQKEAMAETRRHFDRYLRKDAKLPVMEPHGR
jgi:dipeptidyl aminopeptidase/acylaminoacyl peptidase